MMLMLRGAAESKIPGTHVLQLDWHKLQIIHAAAEVRIPRGGPSLARTLPEWHLQLPPGQKWKLVRPLPKAGLPQPLEWVIHPPPGLQQSGLHLP